VTLSRVLLVLTLVVSACAPAALSAPTESPTLRPTLPANVETTGAPETPRPSVSVAPPPAGCANGFAVQSGSIVVRITERVGPIAVHEAVIESDALSGAFVVSGARRFDSCSAIVADLRKLRSTDSVPGEDVRQRDEHIHEEFLETATFPYAVLALAGIDGVPDPLPASGTWQATVVGDMTLHGKTRPVSWKVSATRDGESLTATATAEIQFADFNIFRPNQVLSLGEAIRVEVKVATRSR